MQMIRTSESKPGKSPLQYDKYDAWMIRAHEVNQIEATWIINDEKENSIDREVEPRDKEEN